MYYYSAFTGVHRKEVKLKQLDSRGYCTIVTKGSGLDFEEQSIVEK